MLRCARPRLSGIVVRYLTVAHATADVPPTAMPANGFLTAKAFRLDWKPVRGSNSWLLVFNMVHRSVAGDSRHAVLREAGGQRLVGSTQPVVALWSVHPFCSSARGLTTARFMMVSVRLGHSGTECVLRHHAEWQLEGQLRPIAYVSGERQLVQPPPPGRCFTSDS